MSESSSRSGAKALVALLALGLGGFFLLLVAAVGGLSGAAPQAVPALGRVALWLPLVHATASPFGIPDALELGLLSVESGGDYLSTLEDSNGTTDAGLGQINSGPHPQNAHWAAFGLLANPYDPARNVAASVQILAADLQGNGGDIASGLYAYNAGSAVNGERYDPRYAPDVLAAATALDAAPVIAVWPVDGNPVGHGGDTWAAPASAGAAHAYVVIAACAPTGDPFTFAGQQWQALSLPSTVTDVVGGAALAVQPSSQAPSDLETVMPPGAVYWWLVSPVSGAPVNIDVQATWNPGQGAAEAPGTVATATIRLQQEA